MDAPVPETLYAAAGGLHIAYQTAGAMSDLDPQRHDDRQVLPAPARRHTHSDQAPWYVVPADDKWAIRALVSQVVNDTLAALDLQYPKLSPDGDTLADRALKTLQNERD